MVFQMAACAADWQWKASQVTVSSLSATQVAARDATRYGLWLSSFNSRMLWWPAGAPTNIYSPGFILATYTFGQPYLALYFDRDGAVVQEAWFGAPSSGSDTAGVLEILYRPAARQA